MKILFLSRWFPYPPNNGSKLRIYNLLQGLSRHHEVTLLSFRDHSDVKIEMSALQKLCGNLISVPYKSFNPKSYQARLGFFNFTPRSVIATFSEEMKQQIERALSTETYDVVIASQIDMAGYCQYFSHLPAIFEEVEVAVLYERFAKAASPWQRLRAGLTWAKHKHYLNSLFKNFDVCTVVSDLERQLLSQKVNGKPSIEVIPNCVDLADYAQTHEIPQPDTLIFTGSFSYFPNYEAMVWFLDKVYPIIQAQVPDVRLFITGDHMNRALPPVSNITLTGFVEDIHPLIARAWCSVVPLHIGGGTRLKILEAMALGTPVIATSKGAEGLEVQAGRHLLIADTPETFAYETIRLLKETELRQQLADNARQLIRDRYDWAVVMPRFLDLVEQYG